MPPGFVIEAAAFAALGTALTGKLPAAEGAARRTKILGAELPAGLSAELEQRWRLDRRAGDRAQLGPRRRFRRRFVRRPARLDFSGRKPRRARGRAAALLGLVFFGSLPGLSGKRPRPAPRAWRCWSRSWCRRLSPEFCSPAPLLKPPRTAPCSANIASASAELWCLEPSTPAVSPWIAKAWMWSSRCGSRRRRESSNALRGAGTPPGAPLRADFRRTAGHRMVRGRARAALSPAVAPAHRAGAQAPDPPPRGGVPGGVVERQRQRKLPGAGYPPALLGRRDRLQPLFPQPGARLRGLRQTYWPARARVPADHRRPLRTDLLPPQPHPPDPAGRARRRIPRPLVRRLRRRRRLGGRGSATQDPGLGMAADGRLRLRPIPQPAPPGDAFRAADRSLLPGLPAGRAGPQVPAELREGLRAFLEIRRHGWNGGALADAAAMVCYGLLGRSLRRLFRKIPASSTTC